MGYILEKVDEAARLEEQSLMSAYSMQEELKFLRVSPSQETPFRMLDAGCGSGVLSRYLSEHFMGTSIEACDFSEHRIRQAKTRCQLPSHHKIHFFTSALEQLSVPDESYDLVICRYVYEHLANHSKVTSEFFRVLKPGGTVYLIDFDGIIFNLYHQNKRLGRLISKFKANLGLDLFIGRKMPGLLCAAQFQDVQWTVEAISFQGLNLQNEYRLMQQRLVFALPALKKALGSRKLAIEFKDLYCHEMLQPGSSLFYNKFIVHGVKPMGKKI